MHTNMTEVSWKQTRLKWVVICVCIVTFVLLVLVIQCSVKRSNVLDQKEKTGCVPCYELTCLGNEDLTGFEQKNESDVVTCCSARSNVLDRLIEKYGNSKHKELRYSRIIGSVGENCEDKELNKNKPFVKMTGLNFTKMAIDADKIIEWNSTEYKGDVKPLDSKIFIKKPGFYFVFSLLKFQLPKSDSCIVHIHYVYKHSYYTGNITPLLENAKSFCDITSTTTEITSTVGAVFQLEEHDMLFVRNSHPDYLVTSVHSNMFGLFMM